MEGNAMTEQDALCDRAEAAIGEVPFRDWTMPELRAFVDLLESVVGARRPVDEVGNLVYLARRRSR